MSSNFLRRAIAIGLLAALASGPAAAEEQEIGRLRIVDPTASAAPEGEASPLRMRLHNGGFDSLHIVGMTSPVAGEITIDLPVGRGEARPLQSIPLPANEGTSVGPSHIRVLLKDLRKRLAKGDRVPVTLHFSGGQKVDMQVLVGRDNGQREN